MSEAADSGDNRPSEGEKIAFFNSLDLYHTSRAPVQIKGLERVVWSYLKRQLD